MQTDQLHRIIFINDLIKDGKYPSCSYLAGKLQVNQRTIERDIETMKKEFKAPIKYCRMNKGYFYTEERYFLPSMMLSEGEIFGLLLAQKLLSQYENTPYEERLRSAFTKLQKYLPDKFEMETGSFRKSCSFDLGFVRKINMDLFEDLISAIRDRQQLRIYYYTISRNEKSWRVIDPYHMKNYKGEWYLAAYCHNRNKVIYFSPIIILEHEETGETFKVKEDFIPEEFWATSFGIYKDKEGKIHDVVIRIDEYQSRWINEFDFTDYRRVSGVEHHEDGSMTLRLQAEGLEEIQRWVMQYGSHMEVLEPEGLREKIKKEVEGMRKSYGV